MAPSDTTVGRTPSWQEIYALMAHGYQVAAMHSQSLDEGDFSAARSLFSAILAESLAEENGSTLLQEMPSIEKIVSDLSAKQLHRCGARPKGLIAFHLVVYLLLLFTVAFSAGRYGRPIATWIYHSYKPRDENIDFVKGASPTATPMPTQVLTPNPTPTPLGEDAHWRVRFYQDANATGYFTKFDVSPDGASAVPIDQFEKYSLQDAIKSIRYTLPRGVFVVCFAGRFFKNVDGDIANFINNNQILKEVAGQVGIRMSNDVLALEGTGGEKVIDLNAIGWANRIRSAKLVKP
jgi:hypothetical protein